MKVFSGGKRNDHSDEPVDLLRERVKELSQELRDLRERCDRQQEQLALALDALQYCSVDPGVLDPMKLSQWKRAMTALEKIKEVL